MAGPGSAGAPQGGPGTKWPLLRAYGAAAVRTQGELGLSPNVPGGGYGPRELAAPGSLLRGACGSAVRATANSSEQRATQRKTGGECPTALPPSQCTRTGHSPCYLNPLVLYSWARPQSWSPSDRPVYETAHVFPASPGFVLEGFPGCPDLPGGEAPAAKRWLFLSALAHLHQILGILLLDGLALAC